MPSRPLDPSSAAAVPPPLHHHILPQHKKPNLLLPLLAASLTFIFLFLLILLCVFLYRRLSRSRTAPATTDSKSPHHLLQHSQLRRFSYSLLRRSTGSFSPTTLLGHGGFGSVHKATLPTHHPSPLAVKLMDPTRSPLQQGEREFHNELSLAHLTLSSPHILSLLGFSSNRKGDRLLLVYELMPNRSLQESLLESKRPELSDWSARFAIALDVARGLEYLHHSCDPPVIHGDIKPSNVLLDGDFRAKIGDFGLARLKTDYEDPITALEGNSGNTNNNGGEGDQCVRRFNGEDNGSILEETESVLTGCTEGADQSPESCVIRVVDAGAVSPEMGMEKGSASEGCFDGISMDNGAVNGGERKATSSRRDWWWKQDSGGGVKDYVMEWIGNEIKKERPKTRWVDGSGNGTGTGLKAESKRKQKKQWEWWVSLDDKEEKVARKPRKWWKEEFCDELSRKAKKKKKTKRGHSSSNGNGGGELWWQNEDEEDFDESGQERKKRKSTKSNSLSSIDWWLDGLSGELMRNNGRRNSQEWASCNSGDANIPKSGAVSSTPSMRGTVCYIAPEYGGAGGPGLRLSEKCDVYSFGVLLLVLVSGRRPLQVTASPMSEFERANLISWARQLACNGKLLDLVDKSIHSLDEDQAVLCITIALLCLQRCPSKRPSMREIVEMLSGHAGPPQLPFEFSPSPPSNARFKSLRKAQ
ncbi:receptor-like serine/threonine-protein kinase At2g45590 [Punica granatum]|uniref:non-specific serine/threonine protein kinase n=2 Tax=Punica granatum TaxID=22663 RepID=A0A2I0IZY4_PUNGR|nr:receptor-like serine/threonine-protein kinase At2g45590 [Punica granatum]PKI49559.1 hypothetical protein CRG98_030052 [Punica granatum]